MVLAVLENTKATQNYLIVYLAKGLKLISTSFTVVHSYLGKIPDGKPAVFAYGSPSFSNNATTLDPLPALRILALPRPDRS
jgi:hypothetical protein